MPIETLSSGTTQQPEGDNEVARFRDQAERHAIVNYSEQKQYLYKHAAVVALEVFGEDFSRPGLFFSEAGSDHDVPYLVVCEGQGRITSYNLFDSGKAASRGLNGIVITEAEAEYLRTA